MIFDEGWKQTHWSAIMETTVYSHTDCDSCIVLCAVCSDRPCAIYRGQDIG